MTNRLLIALLLLTYHAAYADYFLCGSDEDGCLPGREMYCACIPVGVPDPYCLDFNTVTCKPFDERLGCDLKFSHQADCLATLYQSVPIPPCGIVTESFCRTHGAYICDPDGHFSSCKK